MHHLQKLQELYDQTFSVENFNFEPKGLYKPVMHIMAIPGKRIRPMLLLLSCEAFGGKAEQALNPAYAMEIFHNFTLVHDDIMDQADLRRGRPTVHKLFGLNAGILAGDVMMSYAYRYLCQIEEKYLHRVFEVFNKTTIEIYEGQQMDVDFETRLDVTIPEYLKMIEYKTSVLLAVALQIGAIVAGASVADQEKIYNFGLNLGLSFQIKDDWLDTFGDGEKVGKRIGGDILQNKKTYLLITALQKATKEDKARLIEALHEKEESKKLETVMDLYSRYEVNRLTLEEAEDRYRHAIESLKAVSLPEQNKAALYQIAASIHTRDF
ncbi:MAG: polyprenyl synthetase family protein [Chitinophagales bacterium]